MVRGDSNIICSGNRLRSDLGKGALRATSASVACFGHVRSSKVLGSLGVGIPLHIHAIGTI